MIRASTAILMALAVAGCSEGYVGGEAGNAAYDSMAQGAMPPMSAPAPADIGFEESAKMERQVVQPDPDGAGGGAPPGTAPMMSYTYAWNFAVPTEGMEGLQKAHKKLCEDAGPANCYVTNSYLDAIGQKEGASGALSMRATEAWVRTFEAGVSEGLKPFGASIYSTNRGAEELTAQIVDHEARLRSMRAHRDALRQMVEDKPGRLSDLLEIQQALAQAQGEIDSRESVLAALKLRVSMSVLNFSYQAEYAPAAQSIWRPVTDAFGDFAPAFARTIGAFIRFVAAVLPVVIFGGIALWIVWLVYRRRRTGALRPVVGPAAAEKTSSDAKS